MRQLCASLREPSSSTSAPVAAEDAAGIVTTLKGVGDTLAAWCTFHLASRFTHLYLYFDDPAEMRALEPLLAQLRRRWDPARISATAVDDALRAEWRALPRADMYMAHAPTEVQVRQQLNATHAMARAVRDGEPRTRTHAPRQRARLRPRGVQGWRGCSTSTATSSSTAAAATPRRTSAS